MRHVSLPKMLLILLIGISAFIGPLIALAAYADHIGWD